MKRLVIILVLFGAFTGFGYGPATHIQQAEELTERNFIGGEWEFTELSEDFLFMLDRKFGTGYYLDIFDAESEAYGAFRVGAIMPDIGALMGNIELIVDGNVELQEEMDTWGFAPAPTLRVGALHQTLCVA